MLKNTTNQLTAHFFRHQYGQMVAILVRYFGLKEIEIAEDIVQDTLVEAMEKWSARSIPENPEGWLMDVAKKKLINYLNRSNNFKNNILPKVNPTMSIDTEESVGEDSMLRMIFTCCHPDLPVESQISLALKTLCGLSVPEIAHALLTTESTVNKRLYRAKQKFREGTIRFHIPTENYLPERLDSVFSTLYLFFNEGYFSSHHEEKIRIDLCFDAIRLLKEVISFYTLSSKGQALMSLMLLTIARFESRIDDQGALVILSEQNRAVWDAQLIAEGMEHLHQAMIKNELSTYHLQAGIAAEHCLAINFESTNWKSIYKQYCILENLNPSIIISFNKAIAKFYAYDKKEAIDDLIALEKHPVLKANKLYYESIGVLYMKLNQKSNATPYFDMALKLSTSVSEKRLIEQRING